MRLALFPDVAGAYHERMLDGFHEGFRAADDSIEVVVARKPLNKLDHPLDWKASGIDVVLQINGARPADLPNEVRHICWVQDIFPDTEQSILATVRPGDMVYTFGDPDLLGIRRAWPCFSGVLFTGVSAWWAQEHASIAHDLDLSIVGFIPSGNAAHYANSPALETFRQWVASQYQPLCGALDLRPLHQTVQDEYVKGAVRDYVRFLDRVLLANLALSVSTKVEFHGLNWGRYPVFKPYARPHINSNEGLRAVYQRSAINLSSNPNGFGVHSRQLECMATGGFVMIHRSPMENKPGGMRAHFEPGVHYGEYSPGEFREQVGAWLGQPDKRKEAGRRARLHVLQNHSWLCRARQVLSDLKNTA